MLSVSYCALDHRAGDPALKELLSKPRCSPPLRGPPFRALGLEMWGLASAIPFPDSKHLPLFLFSKCHTILCFNPCYRIWEWSLPLPGKTFGACRATISLLPFFLVYPRLPRPCTYTDVKGLALPSWSPSLSLTHTHTHTLMRNTVVWHAESPCLC